MLAMGIAELDSGKIASRGTHSSSELGVRGAFGGRGWS
jgi:hypothetical protein